MKLSNLNQNAVVESWQYVGKYIHLQEIIKNIISLFGVASNMERKILVVFAFSLQILLGYLCATKAS